jgi:hypothetical protein
LAVGLGFAAAFGLAAALAFGAAFGLLAVSGLAAGAGLSDAAGGLAVSIFAGLFALSVPFVVEPSVLAPLAGDALEALDSMAFLISAPCLSRSAVTVKLVMPLMSFFTSSMPVSLAASLRWFWNSRAMPWILRMYWPIVRKSRGRSLGPITISATMAINKNSLEPRPKSNMRGSNA